METEKASGLSRKVIFFDCYQTLIDIQLFDEKNIKLEEQKGWERFISLLNQKYEVDVSVSEFLSFLAKRSADFYAGKDKTIYHHNLFALISEVLEKDLRSKVSNEEILYLIYEYRKISRGYVRLYPKIAKTLVRLAKKYSLSIASYTQSSFTRPELRELGIEKYFSHFVFSSDIGFRKKSTEFYKECLRVVAKKPNDCVMVGDNYYEDISLPAQLGINTVWIKNPVTYSKYHDLPTTEIKGAIDLKEFDRLPEIIDILFKKERKE
ncbi:HAD family hydrolase [Patescibacteria group bacterium]|nr:HAD family hydrolase [Patescibacteria group bacterium]